MTRFGLIVFCPFPVMAASAAENLIESGQWKITSNIVMNGAASPPQMKARCLAPKQTSDVGKTFGPLSGTVNSICEQTEYEATGRTLKWRLQCRGQLDVDVAGNFNFDTLCTTQPHHLQGPDGGCVYQRREDGIGGRARRQPSAVTA